MASSVLFTSDFRLGVLPRNAKTSSKSWSHNRRVGETSIEISSQDDLVVNLQTNFGCSRCILLVLDVQIPSLDFCNGDKKTLKLLPGLLEVHSDGAIVSPLFNVSSTNAPDNDSTGHDSNTRIQPMQWHRLIILVNYLKPRIAAIWLDNQPLSLFKGIKNPKKAEEIFRKKSFQIGHTDNETGFFLRFLELQHHSNLNIANMFHLEDKKKLLDIPGGKAFNIQKAAQDLNNITKMQQNRLSLNNVFATNTIPIWQSSAWAAEFCDPFMKGTGLDLDLQCDKSFGVLINVLCQIQGVKPKGDSGEDDDEGDSALSGGSYMPTGNLFPSFDQENDSDYPHMEVDTKVEKTAKTICEIFYKSKALWKSYASFVDASMNGSRYGADDVASVVVKKLVSLFRETIDLGKPCIIPAGWITDNTDISCKSWYFVTVLIMPGGTKEDTSLGGNRIFNVWICNPCGEGMEWHPSMTAYPHKNKFRNSIALPHIRYERLVDQGFWTMFYGMSGHLSQSQKNKCKSFMFYNTLLPWLCEQPLESAIAQGISMELKCPWRSPPYSETSHFRSILEGIKCYLSADSDLQAEDKVKLFSFQIRFAMIEMAIQDLNLISVISDEEMLLIKMATEQLSLAAVKVYDRDELSKEELKTVRLTIERAEDILKHKPKLGSSMSRKNLVSLNNTGSKMIESDDILHPFFERIAYQDVRGKVGASIPLPKQLPVNFLQQKQRLVNPFEIFDALRQVEVFCLELSGLEAQGSVKRSSYIKISLLTSVFTSIIPLPPPPNSSRSKHAWEFTPVTPLLRGQQEEMVQLLGRLCNHFVASCFSTKLTKCFDGTRLVVLGAITAICDYLIRQKPEDNPSPLTLILRGENIIRDDASHKLENKKSTEKVKDEDKKVKFPSFGIRSMYFMQQTDNAGIASPEVNIARTSINEYFEMQKIPEGNYVFEWDTEKWSMKLNDADASLCKIIGNTFYQKVGGNEAFLISGEDSFICKNIVLFSAWRDICFWFKYVQCTDDDVFPRLRDYACQDAEIQWKWDGQDKIFEVKSKMKSPLNLRHSRSVEGGFSPIPKPSNLRWDSDASITSLGIDAKSEDDLLHIQKLPLFENVIGQAEAELFLSYLSVPYMRIPCLLEFFSTESRIHALGCKDIRRLLEGAILEPGHTIPTLSQNIAPRHVPCIDNEVGMIGSTYGLLLNECAKAPQLAPVSLLKLLEQAIALGSGGKQSFHSKTTTIITFVLRMASYVEAALAFLLQLATNTHPSLHYSELSGIKLTEQSRRDIEEAFEKSQSIIRKDMRETLMMWKTQLEKEHKKAIQDSPDEVDTVTKNLCDVHAQLLLTVRNVPLRAYSDGNGSHIETEDMRILLTSSLFLMRRNTFNKNSLCVPEHEIYNIIHHRRTDLISFVRSQHETNPRGVHALLQEVFEVGTGKSDHMTAWAAYSGGSNIGRYATTHFERKDNKHKFAILDNALDKIPFIASSQAKVEINLQLLQVTIQDGGFLQALDDDIANDDDMKGLFGNDLAALQAFNVGSYVNMKERKLESWPYTIQQWTADDSLPENTNIGDEYDPTDLRAHETWIKDAFEPCRSARFPNSKLKWYFASDNSVHAYSFTDVVILVGKNAEKGSKPWLEAAIHKSSQMVQVFMIRSYGRRFYRTLEYSTNSLYTYRDLQPSTDDRSTQWPSWARHEAFEDQPKFEDHIRYWTPPSHPKSVVILRHRDSPDSRDDKTSLPTDDEETQSPPQSRRHTEKNSLSNLDMDGPIWIYSEGINKNDAFNQLKEALNEAGFKSVRYEYGSSVEIILGQFKDLKDNKRVEFALVHVPTRTIQVKIGDDLDTDDVNLLQELSKRLRKKGWDAPDISLHDQSWIPLKKFLPSRTFTAKPNVVAIDETKVGNEPDDNELEEIETKSSEMEKKGLEQYLPSHLFAGLLPEALLEMYDIYQENNEDSQVLYGYPKCTETDNNKTNERKFRLVKQKDEDYGHWLTIELIEKEEKDHLSRRFVTTVNTSSQKRQFAKVTRHSAKEGRKHVLLPTLYARSGSQLSEIASILSRVESLSQVLVWTEENPDISTYKVDYVELVRLKLRFKMKEIDGRCRLYSESYPGLYLPDAQSKSGEISAQKLSSTIPHSLILCSEFDEYIVLVPNVKPVRPMIKNRPFSCELVFRTGKHAKIWSKQLNVKFFKYNVHTSGAFLESETLGSALYLMVMYVMSRSYVKAFMLVRSVSSDVSLTPEEEQILKVLSGIQSGHPNFHALRVALMLALTDSSAVLEWDLREEFALYLQKQSHIHVRCRLTQQEEQLAMKLCEKEKDRLDFLKGEIKSLSGERKQSLLQTVRREAGFAKGDSTDETDTELIEARNDLQKFAVDCCEKCECKGIMTNVDEVKHRFLFLIKRNLRTEMRLGNH